MRLAHYAAHQSLVVGEQPAGHPVDELVGLTRRLGDGARLAERDHVARGTENGKYYLYEDQTGKLRFGYLEEIPAHLKRGKQIALGKV